METTATVEKAGTILATHDIQALRVSGAGSCSWQKTLPRLADEAKQPTEPGQKAATERYQVASSSTTVVQIKLHKEKYKMFYHI